MNRPTEIAKKDIIRLALDRLGDQQKTWDYLKPLGISRPPQRKIAFVVAVEARRDDDPETWSTQTLGRVMYHASRNVAIDKVEDTTETPIENLNEGTVSVADFLTVATSIKKSEGYCPEFWNVLDHELGVARPTSPPRTVSFTLSQVDFENAGLDSEVEITAGVLRRVMDEMEDNGYSPQNLTVADVVASQ